jgi:NTE family protein
MRAGRPRIGLVLGAGGVVGVAYHAGVLAGLAEAMRWDPREAEVIVGTSAGSITGASLRAGLAAPDMLARAEDRPLSGAGERLLAQVGPPQPPARPMGVRVRPVPEVAATLARAAARPFAARPAALLASLMPEGALGTELISAPITGLFPDAWPDRALWLCAVRQRDGHLVVFGRGDRPRPRVADAVAASCAIPSFFQPVKIGDDLFIDGGVHSPTNADVLTRSELDVVIVSSPMSLGGRQARMSPGQPARRWSRLLLESEARKLRRRGTHVVAFQPRPADLEVLGRNAMDPRRRGAVARQAYESTLRRLERSNVLAELRP